MREKKKKGFSLVELIVVVAIMGVMAAFLIPSFIGMREDSNRKAVDSAVERLAGEVVSVAESPMVHDGIMELANQSSSREIRVSYTQDEDRILVYSSLEVVDAGGTPSVLAENIAEVSKKMKDSLNGTIEPIEVVSSEYKDMKLVVTLKVTEERGRVSATYGWE